MSEIEKYYNGEIHVDFEEDKPLLTKEEAEEYYNKLWLENKELIQENIDKLNTKRFALEMELIEKDKEIERLHNIIKEVREYIENNSKEGPIEDKRYFYSPEQANDILKILEKENKND